MTKQPTILLLQSSVTCQKTLALKATCLFLLASAIVLSLADTSTENRLKLLNGFYRLEIQQRILYLLKIWQKRLGVEANYISTLASKADCPPFRGRVSGVILYKYLLFPIELMSVV